MSLQQDQQHLDDILEAAHAAALEFLKSLPTRPAGRAPQLLSHYPLPDEGLGATHALATFRARYEAWLSASPGPRYLGFVTGGVTPAALAGDWLVSAYDQNAISGNDSTVPEIERETVALLRALFNLPDGKRVESKEQLLGEKTTNSIRLEACYGKLYSVVWTNHSLLPRLLQQK